MFKQFSELTLDEKDCLLQIIGEEIARYGRADRFGKHAKLQLILMRTADICQTLDVKVHICDLSSLMFQQLGIDRFELALGYDSMLPFDFILGSWNKNG